MRRVIVLTLLVMSGLAVMMAGTCPPGFCDAFPHLCDDDGAPGPTGPSDPDEDL